MASHRLSHTAPHSRRHEKVSATRAGGGAATCNGEAFPFDPYELRAVDEAIGGDVLLCVDALRWAQADLHTLVPDGDRRVRAVIERSGLPWPVEQ